MKTETVRGRRVVLMGLLAAVLATFALGAAPAYAGNDANCEIYEVGASNSANPGVAPELKPLEKKLKKPPLTSWNTFKLIARHDKRLEMLKADTTKLAIGQASVLLREIQRSEGHKVRLGMSLTMDDKGGKRVLETKFSVDAGDYMVFGTNLPNDEGHIFAIACQAP